MGVSNLTCVIEGCLKPRNSKGLCTTHARRVRVWGDPMRTAVGTHRAERATDQDRFLVKIDRSGPSVSDALGPCWIWRASVRKDGYGQFWYRKTNGTAHRAAYELFIGPVPEGLQVLHRCDVPMCARPDHLFLGTQQDNMDDMVAKGRDVGARILQCLHGHPYNSANTIIRKDGSRACRTCKRAAQRTAYLRKRSPGLTLSQRV